MKGNASLHRQRIRHAAARRRHAMRGRFLMERKARHGAFA
jgi:hypothetical protein